MEHTTEDPIDNFLWSEEGETDQPPGPRLGEFRAIAVREEWPEVIALVDAKLFSVLNEVSATQEAVAGIRAPAFAGSLLI